MAERGAEPQVSTAAKRVLRAARALTTPLVPDDYLEMINPLWSTRELRGRVERVEKETETAGTVVIKPGYQWQGHEPGQYIRIGVDIDGKRHWRAYSLTSEPDRKDGCITITPKLVEEGQVSPFFVRRIQPGTIVFLGKVEGTFTLPDPAPEKLLFITAGSGITPVMSMLRALAKRDGIQDVVHLHSARTKDDVIFAKELRDLPGTHNGFKLHEQITSESGRLAPEHLDELCPDWKEREAFVCGPGEMIDAMAEHWDKADLCDQLHLERFQPVIGEAGEQGEGGTICFLESDKKVESDGSKPILESGEEAGLDLNYGCRIGICHTCVGKLKSGQLRDLRSGEVFGQEGEIVRICISAPEGQVELEL